MKFSFTLVKRILIITLVKRSYETFSSEIRVDISDSFKIYWHMHNVDTPNLGKYAIQVLQLILLMIAFEDFNREMKFKPKFLGYFMELFKL